MYLALNFLARIRAPRLMYAIVDSLISFCVPPPLPQIILCPQALPSTLIVHFAAADLEEAARNVEGAKKVYEDLLAPLEAAAPEDGSPAPVPLVRYCRTTTLSHARREPCNWSDTRPVCWVLALMTELYFRGITECKM